MSLASFELFPRMPFELQLAVWKFASTTGPMRLDLVNAESSWDDSTHDFVLPSQWHHHVTILQNQRRSVMHSCRVARQAALRHFDMVRCLDIPLFFYDEELEDYRSGANTSEAKKAAARHIIIDWEIDLIYLAESGCIETSMPWLFPQTTPLQKITNLALHSDSFFPLDVVEIVDNEDFITDVNSNNKTSADKYESEASFWLERHLPELESLEELVFVIDDTLTSILWDFDNAEFEDFLRGLLKDEYSFTVWDSMDTWDFGGCCAKKKSDNDATRDCHWQSWCAEMNGVLALYKAFEKVLKRENCGVQLRLAIETNSKLVIQNRSSVRDMVELEMLQ